MELNKLIRLFNENGYVVIKSLFNRNEIDKFKKESDRLSELLIQKYSPPYVNLTKDRRLNTAHNLNKIFPKTKLLKIKSNKTINNFLQKLFKEKSNIRNLELFSKPAKTGMAAPYHQDNFYWNVKDKRAVNLWIAVDKVTKSNGCLIYLEGSHKKGLLQHTPSGAKGTSQEIRKEVLNKLKYKKKYLCLNKGDAVIHHCEVIHGSKKNLTDRNRKSIVLSFKAKTSKYDKKKIDKYLKVLKKELQKK